MDTHDADDEETPAGTRTLQDQVQKDIRSGGTEETEDQRVERDQVMIIKSHNNQMFVLSSHNNQKLQ